MAFMKKENTVKRTDPATVERATTYSGKVARIVHVVSDAGLAEYAEHWNQKNKYTEKKLKKKNKYNYILPPTFNSCYTCTVATIHLAILSYILFYMYKKKK